MYDFMLFNIKDISILITSGLDEFLYSFIIPKTWNKDTSCLCRVNCRLYMVDLFNHKTITKYFKWQRNNDESQRVLYLCKCHCVI